MINKVERTSQFKKDFKKAIKRGCKEEDFRRVLNILLSQKSLPEKYCDHALNNCKEYKNVRECHINPDWLLIYSIQHKELILQLIRTGSHSELFRV
jgi:mRNA interferase YafQ